MRSQERRSKKQQDFSPPPLTEPLWTVDDVANYLRLKQETVRMMARANKLPALKVGKAWRFRISDVKDMLRTEEN